MGLKIILLWFNDWKDLPDKHRNLLTKYVLKKIIEKNNWLVV